MTREAEAVRLPSVLDKVRKLLRLSTSSNPHEAALAAARAQDLIDRHRLSQTVLELDPPPSAPAVDREPIMNFKDAPLDGRPRLERWRTELAVAVARANACRIYLHGSSLMLVGRPSDAETVRYLYGRLAHEVERLAADRGHGKGVSWRNNFRLGVVETIEDKLKAQRQTWRQQVRAEARGNPEALMRVDQALVRMVDRYLEVGAWMRTNMRLGTRSGGGSVNYDRAAREAGRRAGQSIEMGGARRTLASAARMLT